jgi:hypothetical protein
VYHSKGIPIFQSLLPEGEMMTDDLLAIHEFIDVARSGDRDSILRLLSRGVTERAQAQAILDLVHLNEYTKVAILAGCGINLDSKIGECTALGLVTALQNTEGVKLLLELGASINAKSGRSGCTPLMQAVINMDHSTAQLLLGSGAEVSIVSDSGMTALDFARLNGDDDLIKLLTQSK